MFAIGPAHALFLLIAISGCCYVTVRKRAFDLPALAFLGSCFYFLPGFVGIAGYPEGLIVRAVTLEPTSFVVMSFVLAMLLMTLVFSDILLPAPVPTTTHDDRRTTAAAHIASILAISGAVMTVLSVGPSLFAGDKSALLGELNRWHLLWTASATIGAVTAFAGHLRFVLVVNVLLLMLNLYVGFRVDLVITGIAIAAFWLMSKTPGRLLSHWKLGVAVICVGLALFVAKYVLVAIQQFDVDLLVSQLKNPNAFTLIFLYSEPFIAQGTLNEVVRLDFSVGSDHLWDVLYLVVPFAIELGATAEGFNPLFQPALFSSVTDYGLGSNIWAEMLATGGSPLLALFVTAYCVGLLVGDRIIRRVPQHWSIPGIVVLTYWAFYVHRNDLLYQLTLTRRILLAAIAILLGAVVLRAIRLAWFQLKASPIPMHTDSSL